MLYLCSMAGIYIHVPFCKQACHYCDFHFSISQKYRADIVKALARELELQQAYLNGAVVETVYFGGGTPSLLSADELLFLFDAIIRHYNLASYAEITLEANPDDLHAAQVAALRQTPINRFSIGIQSFFDEDLRWMNRAHHGQEAIAAIKRVQDAGFNNLTGDLIYGYPLLNNEKWQQNMDTFFALQIPHLSAYSLTVEPRTALASFIKKKASPPLDDKQSADHFTALMDRAAREGFEHYEISNYARPGHYSRHNSNYWKGVHYLGIGPSAHSYNEISRQWNVANNAHYLQALAGGSIPAEIETLTTENQLNEYVMTSIRTHWGLDLNVLNKMQPGAYTELLKTAQVFIQKGWMQQQGQVLTLTPSGKLYADHIAAELFF